MGAVRALAVLLGVTGFTPGVDAACPGASSLGGRSVLQFSDGALAFRGPLGVVADGAAAAYAPGDHGFSYINGALELWDSGRAVSCAVRDNLRRCTLEFQAVEAADFAAGSPEFCVSGNLRVVAPEPNAPVPCGPGKFLVGNGKGRLWAGPEVADVSGARRRTYRSMTALQHLIGDKAEPLDALTVPYISVPVSLADRFLGRVAVVSVPQSSVSFLAVVGHTGAEFGTASVALHEKLVFGGLSRQRPGPISAQQRCRAGELRVRDPFVSVPDIPGESCRRKNSPNGAADIRAKEGLANVDVLILGVAPVALAGRAVTREVTNELLQSAVTRAGVTPEDIAKMLACLR